MKPDHERVTKLLTDTVTLLCKNGLTYNQNLKIQGLIAVTLDDSEFFVVQICNTFATNDQSVTGSSDTEPASRQQSRKRVASTDEIVDLTRLVETPDVRVQNRVQADSRVDIFRPPCQDALSRSQDQHRQNRPPPAYRMPPRTYPIPQNQRPPNDRNARNMSASNDALVNQRYTSSRQRTGSTGPRLMMHSPQGPQGLPPVNFSPGQHPMQPPQSNAFWMRNPQQHHGSGPYVGPGVDLGDPMANSNHFPIHPNFPHGWPPQAGERPPYFVEPQQIPHMIEYERAIAQQINPFSSQACMQTNHGFVQQPQQQQAQQLQAFNNPTGQPSQMQVEGPATSSADSKQKRHRSNRGVEHHIDLCVDDPGDLFRDAVLQEVTDFQIPTSSIVIQPDHLPSDSTALDDSFDRGHSSNTDNSLGDTNLPAGSLFDNNEDNYQERPEERSKSVNSVNMPASGDASAGCAEKSADASMECRDET